MKEMFIDKNTLGDGSVWDIAFSKDPQQKYIYLADGENEHVHILDRDSLQVLTSFGDGGRQPGEFYGVHSIATDSKGNIYTTETYRGQRVQKFVYKGLGPVTKKDQGVVWPKKASKSMLVPLFLPRLRFLLVGLFLKLVVRNWFRVPESDRRLRSKLPV